MKNKPSFQQLILAARDSKQERDKKEQQHAALLAKAEPLPARSVILPGDKPAKHTEHHNKVANFVMGKSSEQPKSTINLGGKVKAKGPPKSFKSLLASSKNPTNQSAVAEKKPLLHKKRDILFGTGITKKVIQKAQKQIDKERILAKPETALDQVIKAKEKETLDDQPKIVVLPEPDKKPDDFQWDEDQLKALEGLTINQYGIMDGAAGTGKTTTAKELIAKLEEILPHIDLNIARTPGSKAERPIIVPAMCLCAYTGRAVQQQKRPLDKKYWPMCNTIHATLGYMPEQEEYYSEKHREWRTKLVFRPTFTKYNKLPYKVCIVDEAGMVPVWLWNQLIEALPPDCKIILIGDINQLPPVQGRSVLGFAMLQWPTYTLTKIHRQAADNPIIANAHRILKGFYPKEDKKKFAIRTIPDGSLKAQNTIIAYVQHLTKAGMFDPMQDGLIVAQNKGNIGQRELNEKLVLFFNPTEKDEHGTIIKGRRHIISTGKTHVHYAEGDKVMLLQNDRKRQLTNGMCGVVVSINVNGRYSKDAFNHADAKAEAFHLDDDFSLADDKPGKTIDEEGNPVDFEDEDDEETTRQASHIMTVRFDVGTDIIEVPFSTSGQYATVALAYAFTCHKSQGGEYRNVIVVCHKSNSILLNREWLYTAVTRAKEKIVLLCNNGGLDIAVNRQRITGKTVEEKAQQFLALQDQTDTMLPILDGKDV